MPSEELRRRAGAQGAGDSGVTDPSETKDIKRRDSKPKRTPEETRKILNPDVLEFALSNRGDGSKLKVPTVFTIGDVVQRDALDDWDAYCRLTMIELGKISSLDLAGNPALAFSNENMPYLSIALTTSNVLAFMRRVLAKTAHVEDTEGKRSRATDADFGALGTLENVAIGGNYFGRWIAAVTEKNRPRAESQAT